MGDLDITQFFDRVNHDILMSRLGQTLKDKRMLRIIGAFLRAGVIMPEGLHVRSEEGTPQGGPMTPWTHLVGSSFPPDCR